MSCHQLFLCQYISEISKQKRCKLSVSFVRLNIRLFNYLINCNFGITLIGLNFRIILCIYTESRESIEREGTPFPPT